MSFSWFLQCSFILCFLSMVQTVPPDYCLAALNRSDCGAPPRQVFSYYKPGSRCEIETWRGCPTLNKFENEYLCSLNCIFRMRPPVIEKKPCLIPLNEDKCKNTSSLVYTYINGSCELVQWSGCPSDNKFISKSICEAVCQVPNVESLFMELNKEPLKKIDQLLDNIIQEEAIVSTKETETEVTTEATIETTNETPAEVLTEIHTEEATETPAEETTETPAEEGTETPAEVLTEIRTEEATEIHTEEATETPAEETTETPTGEPEKSHEQSTEDEVEEFDSP